jgi:hypothetical protein
MTLSRCGFGWETTDTVNDGARRAHSGLTAITAGDYRKVPEAEVAWIAELASEPLCRNL